VKSHDLLDYFRTQIKDVQQPRLWKDEEIYSYMDDAQRMFVRLTGGIRDATSDLCTLKLPAGKQFVEYDERIIGIRYAELQSNKRKLRILNLEDEVDGAAEPTLDYGQLSWRSRLSDPDGVVDTLILGMDSGYIRVVPASEETDTATLVIFRDPLCEITTENQNFEIAARHHTSLYLWMASRAYNKQDVDTFDPEKAKGFAKQFADYCELTRQKDINQREHRSPRTVSYGGI